MNRTGQARLCFARLRAAQIILEWLVGELEDSQFLDVSSRARDVAFDLDRVGDLLRSKCEWDALNSQVRS